MTAETAARVNEPAREAQRCKWCDETATWTGLEADGETKSPCCDKDSFRGTYWGVWPIETVAGDVARGAALLDETRPGWFNRIDIGAVDESSVFFSVLAQTWDGEYGLDNGETPYELAAARLWADMKRRGGNERTFGFNAATPRDAKELTAELKRGDVIDSAKRRVFDSPTRHKSRELTAEWKHVILARRAEASAHR